MGIDRRKFITIAGVSALTALSKKVSGVVPGADSTDVVFAPDKPALSGSRWAMVFDVAKCQKEENCTKCIDACNKAHNIPQFDNPKDEVKWIWKEDFKSTFPQQELEHVKESMIDKPFLVMCNQCDNPPCVRVCPTQATWKREKDGIVMIDMHRCIGCRYCMAACPYGSRSFNWRDPRPFIEELNPDYPTRTRGVVEKCDFCVERLAVGEPPACVAACDKGALIFGDMEDPESEVRKVLKDRFAIRRKPALGTNPQVYYLV